MEQRTDRELLEDLVRDVKAIQAAFIRDEDGSPNYSEHKLFHKTQHDQVGAIKARNTKVFSNVITWAVIGALTLIVNHLLPLLNQVLAVGGK